MSFFDIRIWSFEWNQMFVSLTGILGFSDKKDNWLVIKFPHEIKKLDPKFGGLVQTHHFLSFFLVHNVYDLASSLNCLQIRALHMRFSKTWSERLSTPQYNIALCVLQYLRSLDTNYNVEVVDIMLLRMTEKVGLSVLRV